MQTAVALWARLKALRDSLQQVTICDRDAREHGTDDAEEALVGAADVEVL